MWHQIVLIVFLLCEFLAVYPGFQSLATDLHGTTMDFTEKRNRRLVVLVIALLLLLLLEPMGWAPLWNFERDSCILILWWIRLCWRWKIPTTPLPGSSPAFMAANGMICGITPTTMAITICTSV